ncbi:hypothetical protein [Geothermobacter hydrogeniphilus]|uniref:Uncharacterized protein n=1 Tax=Geothermobacter hydrogeniphilus TaxID=1969733 RepID=A0A1X0Y1X4_9BACT|nr:hypothetical protein [Geothermobacter hydrogeniphilus]ORJ59126.1 hypothetical protein B5V00_11200 [Geothermobacter hydrogeniphilus]
MKKVLILLAILSLASASTGFAAYTSGTNGSVTLANSIPSGSADPALTVQLSNNVQLNYLADTTAGLGYILSTYHASGNRTYGSSSGDASIYWADGTQATGLPTTVPTGTGTADFSSWKAL